MLVYKEQRHFLCRRVFEQLVEGLYATMERLDTTLRLAIPVRQRVAVGLLFLANGFTYHQVNAKLGALQACL